MVGPNDLESQIDDILRELGMLDAGPSGGPPAPGPDEEASQKPPAAPSKAAPAKAGPVSDNPEPEKPKEGEPDFPEGEGDTKIFRILAPAPLDKPSEAFSFSPPEKEKASASSVARTAPLPPQEESERPEREGKKSALKREIIEWAKAIVISFAVVFLVFGVLIQVVTVDGKSMEPTLHSGDRLVISGLFYTPKQGDIVIISKESGLNKALVKRIVATGGQVLDITEDGGVTVDGQPLDEPYIKEKIAAGMRGAHDYPVRVPEGCVFVMGDNRNDSTDSRFAVLSFVDEEYILGRVLFRIYPLNKFGAVK